MPRTLGQDRRHPPTVSWHCARERAPLTHGAFVLRSEAILLTFHNMIIDCDKNLTKRAKLREEDPTEPNCAKTGSEFYEGNVCVTLSKPHREAVWRCLVRLF